VTPRVSVIIPCYNTAAYVTDTLASVFAQTWTDYEVIVVNDGSPDTPQLEAAIAPFRDRITYIHTENRGLAGARNTALSAAKGEVVALLDSDDIWMPEYLEYQIARLDENPDVDFVYPNAMMFGGGTGSGRLFMDVHPSEGDVTFASLIDSTCCVMVSLVGRREAIERVGAFDSTLRCCEDYDLWLRAVKAGSRMIYHRRPLVMYRRRKGSLSDGTHRMAVYGLLVMEKLQKCHQLTAEELVLVRKRVHLLESERLTEEAKTALWKGRTREAKDLISEALSHVPSQRLTWVLLLLRVMPKLVQRAYLWRLSRTGFSIAGQ
jgi:cellulose synthase/poly-beta-1,6-N-acetylglucosamine synthase-like glycosyltransferase